MSIAQKMSGPLQDLANKACTERLCVWQCYCAKISPCLIFFFFGDVCQANYPYCKLKVKVLVLILLCVTVCFFETAFLVSENRILLVIPS